MSSQYRKKDEQICASQSDGSITKIDGAPDIFAKSGSSVDITCTVTDAATSSLIWYKDGQIIPVEEWPDVSVEMTKEDKRVISVLSINNLSHQRFGIYSCRPDGLSLQNVTLHVIDAKEQGLRTNGIRRIYSDFTMIVTIISFYMLWQLTLFSVLYNHQNFANLNVFKIDC